MSESRKNWHDQEAHNTLDAEHSKPEILNRFWVDRIENRNDQSIALIRGFIKGRPPAKWSGRAVDRDQWSKIVDAEFKSILEEKNRKRFLDLFQHITGNDILNIDKGERFGISLQNLSRVEVSGKLSDLDKDDINRYMADKNMSATVAICAQGELSELSSDNNKPDAVFSIHSVGKVFTGVIILDLINRGILDEDALSKPIEISESAKSKLPPEVVERLGLVTLTLHDVMLHKGGFGDFLGNYVDAVKAAVRKNNVSPDAPKITNIEDFLQYSYGYEIDLILATEKPTLENLQAKHHQLPALIKHNESFYVYGLMPDGTEQLIKLDALKALEEVHFNSENKTIRVSKSSFPEIYNEITSKKAHPHAELSKKGEPRYSNLGSLLVGLAAEHAYAEYHKVHQEVHALDFNGMLKEFIQKPSGMKVLSDRSPADAKVNDRQNIVEPTPEARYLVGNPSGGYWTNAVDLSRFGVWLADKCKEPNFGRLVEQYGQEFHMDGHTLGHKGESPSASAMLSISLDDGRVIAALSNSGRNDAHILEEAIRTNIFSKNVLDSAQKTETGAIDLTKATQIAEGGTHVLYRFPDAPFVLKLMKQNPNQKELDELERKYAVLYDCFDKDGKQRCIQEQHITHQVLLPGKEPYSAALSIVPYEKCFKAKTKFDFKMEPAELDPYLVEHHQELFSRANVVLVNKDTRVDFNLNDYKTIDERIGAILKRLDNDPKLREVMIEFLNHYRDFYKKTNIILDAMGFENILFFKDSAGDWQFKVGSAIKHDTGKYTNELFDKIHSGSEVDLNNFVNFTHAYFSPANIRAVNACAMRLGLEPVISDVTIDSKSLFTISQKLSVPERMLAYAQHGDFVKMNMLLLENKNELSFDLRNFWAYSRIADEYLKHARPLNALKDFLDTVSKLPVSLPENKDDAKRIEDAKEAIIDRKIMLDKKILLHQEIANPPALKDHRRSYASTAEVSNDNAGGSSTKNIMTAVLTPSGKVVPPKPASISSTASQANNHKDKSASNKEVGVGASADTLPQPPSANPVSTAPKPPGFSTKLTRDSTKK